jgi:hypothetical protein
LKPYLEDTRDAWVLAGDGNYRPPRRGANAVSAQHELLARLAAGSGV